MNTRVLLACATASLALIACERSPTPPSPSPSTTVRPAPARPDNTVNNKPDRNMDSTTTPEDQSNAKEDVELTAAIRRAVVQDDTLSMNAKNIKIMCDTTGAVTLRGVVDSQAEKDLIEQKATQVAGVKSVTNNLEVKTP